MKILYAAGDREGAKIQLLRFLQATFNKNYTIKIAAYQKSNPGLSIDWNLDSLKELRPSGTLNFDNSILENYFKQIKYFNPDLIISDLEIFTSHIANELNIKIWQVSPLLLHYATSHKDKIAIGFFKSYPHHLNNLSLNQHIKNILFNSNQNFVYSHFGDTECMQLIDGFQWIRPYHVKGKKLTPCKHDIVATALHNDKGYIRYLQSYKDAVLFSSFIDENYDDIILKNIYSFEEYECNISNCELCLSRGHTDFLSDAYYNGKYSIIMPNFKETECIMNALYTDKYKLGNIIYNNEQLTFNVQDIDYNLNPKIKFLHQHIEVL